MEYENDNKADKNNATGKGTEIKLGNILKQFIQYQSKYTSFNIQ